MSEDIDRPTGHTVDAGVIGVGSMGRHHARVYSELADVNLVGVADVDESQAASVATKHGARALAMEPLLDAVDVVSVAVPTQYHYDIACECIDRGVDILVEKPFVADPDDGRELIARAERADVTVQVGHVERFNPAVMALDDVLPDLDIIAVDAKRLGPPLEREIKDSAVMDLMIHDIDILLSLVDGEVNTLSASGTRDNRYATATFTFDDGTVGTLTASRVTQEKVRELSITARQCQVNVDYTNRTIEIHRHSLPEYIEQNGDIRYRHESVVERPMIENTEPLKNELSSFVDVATTGEPPVVTAESGLRVLEIARQIDELAFATTDDRSEVTVR